jgi:ElaB/YqjD/DUF883 family membrane-anchored ribosome-binding protein
MASHTAERAGHGASKAADQVTDMAAKTATTGGDAIDDKRERVADALDDAADTVANKGKSVPEPAKRYSRAAKGKLHEAADYVRDHDVEDMGRDAMDAASAHPVASLLVLSAVVIGGSLLVASMLRDDGPDSGESHRPMGLASAAIGLGPKGTETLTRIRDAAMSFALAKAVEAADEIWPGFREHYEHG